MRRRHRISLRPQVRRERNLRVAAGLSVGLIVAGGWYAYRHLPKDALRPSAVLRRVPSPTFLRVERVSIAGAPAAVEPMLNAALSERAGKVWAPWAGGGVEQELLVRFPFLSAATAHRDWHARAVTVAVMLQTPVARATRRGRPAGWLADSGLVFEAPDGAYPPLDLPRVDLGEIAQARLPELADFVTAAAAELPAKLSAVAFRTPEEGWEVTVEDGTTLLWGNLDWTREKLMRLKEVLGDAGKRFGAGLTADLRYFEDGKILVRPAAMAARVARTK